MPDDRRRKLKRAGAAAAIAAALVGGGVAIQQAGKKPPKPPPGPPPGGNVVQIPAGTYTGFPRQVANGIHYRAQGVVVCRGGSDTLRLVNRTGITFEGFKFTGASRAGVFVADSRNIRFIRCESSANGVQGFLSVNSSDLSYDTCTATGNRQQHGFYASNRVVGLTMRNCKASGNGRTGFQCNSEGSSTGATGVTVEGCTFEGNQRAQGGADVNLMGVGTAASRFRFSNVAIRSSAGKRSLYAGPFAAGKHCFGDLINLNASGTVKIESPGVRRF